MAVAYKEQREILPPRLGEKEKVFLPRVKKFIDSFPVRGVVSNIPCRQLDSGLWPLPVAPLIIWRGPRPSLRHLPLSHHLRAEERYSERKVLPGGRLSCSPLTPRSSCHCNCRCRGKFALLWHPARSLLQLNLQLTSPLLPWASSFSLSWRGLNNRRRRGLLRCRREGISAQYPSGVLSFT